MAGLVVSVAIAACSPSSLVTVEGIVVAVDGDLTTVHSFEVLTTSGDRILLEPDPLGDFAFPLPHVGNHMRSLDPVRVTYRTDDDGTMIAMSIEDA